MNTAIVVAAGSGSRFNSTIPKQFLEILGKPVIVHTLEKFEAAESVAEIVLVLSRGEIGNFSTLANKYKFHKIKEITAGGNTRAESVVNGFGKVDPRTEIVAVHDGARPLVSVTEIEAVIEKAREIGAACLVAEIADTIKQIDGEYIAGTLDRQFLGRAFTPQAFHYEILQAAYANSDLSEPVTDECMLLEKLGYPIGTVKGNPRNIKITRADDLLIAEALLATGNHLNLNP